MSTGHLADCDWLIQVHVFLLAQKNCQTNNPTKGLYLLLLEPFYHLICINFSVILDKFAANFTSKFYKLMQELHFLVMLFGMNISTKTLKRHHIQSTICKA